MQKSRKGLKMFGGDGLPFAAIDKRQILMIRASKEAYLRTEKQYADFVLEFECMSAQNVDGAQGRLVRGRLLPDAAAGCIDRGVSRGHCAGRKGLDRKSGGHQDRTD